MVIGGGGGHTKQKIRHFFKKVEWDREKECPQKCLDQKPFTALTSRCNFGIFVLSKTKKKKKNEWTKIKIWRKKKDDTYLPRSRSCTSATASSLAFSAPLSCASNALTRSVSPRNFASKVLTCARYFKTAEFSTVDLAVPILADRTVRPKVMELRIQ